jgi:hypothetical protein
VAEIGADLTEEDVQRYWMEKCGQTTCRVCNSNEVPGVEELELPSAKAVIFGSERGGYLVHPIRIICPNCGLISDMAAERVSHWKKTGE